MWANLIGLVLLALSLGYWVGGKVADRRPSPRLLGQLVVAAGLIVAAIPFVTDPILDVASEGLDELSAGAVIGSFFATLLLFAPPVFLLGMVSPFAIRLAVDDVTTAGQTAGRLYALSTAGSLLGTFLPALVLIPLIGTQRTMLASAVVLVASGSLLLGRRWLVLAAAVVVAARDPAGGDPRRRGARVRGRVALPVRPRDGERRRAAPLPQRGRGRALGLARRARC